MQRVLVTGASGFIGAALLADLRASGFDAIGAYRTARGEGVVISDIDGRTDWSRALEGVSAVVHLAGLAHRKADEAALVRLNEGVARLCASAAGEGVSRFVFMSSIKAAAERTHGKPLRETDTPAPETAYGRAKLAAEHIVLAQAGLQSVALRPPLVIATDAKANVRTLLGLAESGAPLPFADIANKRSLIDRAQLIAAIKSVLTAPVFAPGVFHLASRPSLSTGEMVAALREGMGRPARLFAVPAIALAFAPRVLTESLEVDDAAFRAAYGYGACDLDMRNSLRQTGRAWREGRTSHP